MKNYIYLLCTLFSIFLSFSLKAQGLDALRKRSTNGENTELAAILNSKDIKKMRAYLNANPTSVNNATNKRILGETKYRTSYEYQSLVYDAISKCLEEEMPIEMCKVIIEAGCDLNIPFEGKTPIYDVVENIATHKKSECQTAEALLKLMAAREDFNLNMRYKDLLPPLNYLIWRNHNFLGKFSTDYISNEVLKTFIERGASINTYDQDGNSLITFATETQNDYLAEYLIEKGIDLKRKTDDKYNDALYIAIKSGKLGLVKKIVASGLTFDINTLKNEPYSFRRYPELYDYIAQVCADKANEYKDIKLFQQKFIGRKEFVKKKYEDLCVACADAATDANDIKKCISLFSDVKELLVDKQNEIYKKDIEKLEILKQQMLILAKEQKANLATLSINQKYPIKKFYTEKQILNNTFDRELSFLEYFISNYTYNGLSDQIPIAEGLYRMAFVSAAIQRDYDYYTYQRNGFLDLFLGENGTFLDQGKAEEDKKILTEAFKLCYGSPMLNVNEFFSEVESLLQMQSEKFTTNVRAAIAIHNETMNRRNRNVGSMSGSSVTNSESKTPSTTPQKNDEPKMKNCECEIDYNNRKNRIPEKGSDGASGGEGVIYLKNGDYTTIFKTKEGKWYAAGMSMFDSSFDTMEELFKYLVQKCKDNCR